MKFVVDKAEFSVKPDRNTSGYVRRPLTRRQQEVLHKLVELTERNHYQPSSRELAHALGVQNVADALKAIEIGGWIRSTGRARAIEIPSDVWEEIVNGNSENGEKE